MSCVCIAGKNDVAVRSVHHLLSTKLVPKENCVVCINKTDAGQDSFQRSLLKYSKEQGLKVVALEDLSRVESLVFISLEYDRLVPVAKFKSKELFNIHFSFLPRYKGMYTSTWPILNGETESGVSLHKIDSGIDTGDLIDQMKFKIGDDDTGRDLYLKYTEFGIKVFERNVARLLSGDYPATKQSAMGASYYSKNSIDYNNIQINLQKTAFEVRNQIRAFNFREYQIPSVFGFEIVSAEILESRSFRKPGSILRDENAFLEVATVDYDVRLYKEAAK